MVIYCPYFLPHVLYAGVIYCVAGWDQMTWCALELVEEDVNVISATVR